MKAGFVSLIGRPNAGKSTLVNRLVGSKVAIVSDKPQTTRNRILAVKNRPEGQLVFLDTPGIHKPLYRMNVRMLDAAVQTIREVDVLVLVVDCRDRPGGGDEFVLRLLEKAAVPVVLALNKIDLIAKPLLLPMIDEMSRRSRFAEIVPVSALTGENVDRLEAVLLHHLPEGDAIYPPDFLTDQPERTLVGETVREQVLKHTHAELPFSTAVVVDRFEEPDAKGLMRLFCTILVERTSQKPILIGKRGEMIKRIGSSARLELERLFGTRVFLDLRVKVAPEWRQDDRFLDELGLER